MNVGRWFRRVLPSRTLTLWHLCESEIADRLVTRCGREMRYRSDEPFEFSDAPEGACYWCSRERP